MRARDGHRYDQTMSPRPETSAAARQLSWLRDPTAAAEKALLNDEGVAAWAGFRVGLFEAAPIQMRNQRGEHAVVAMILKGRTRGRIISRGEDCDVSPGPDSVGLFGPSLDIAWSRWDCEPGAERLSVELDFSDLEQAGELETIRSASRELRQNLPLQDRQLASLLRLIADEVRAGSPRGPLYATSLSLRLTAYLFCEHASGGRYRDLERGKLAAMQRARVLELIERRLAEPIGLDELANAAGVSRFHFLRLFKNTFGTTPHQYLLEQRMAGARRLMDQTTLPLTDIAAATGFSSQSHLCTTMRQRLGLTPGQWRRR